MDLLTAFFFLNLGIILLLSNHSSQADALCIANLKIAFRVRNTTLWEIAEAGVFGKASPLKRVSGEVVPPEELHQNACSSLTNFVKPVAPISWIALIMRGQCSFTKKISVAAEKGAAGVIIYNSPGTGNNMFPMFNYGAENIVAVMIGNLKGTDLLHLIQNGIQIEVTIEVGKHLYSGLNRYMCSIFVFLAFFLVYCTYHCIGKLRSMRNPTERCQGILDIKTTINQLELRTLKEDDNEVASNSESCAVCLETYKPKDVVRVLRCRHLFHKVCVDPWLLKNQTCPVCKWNMLGGAESVRNEAEPLGTEEPSEAPSHADFPNEQVSCEPYTREPSSARSQSTQ
ncbi:RING finger protein 148 [Sphaerodactylus townsendi]|uniref:RING finger protein 148 n=1 Tax=Sphaerodactylus townsendi TaxID=933632 RepID=UPI0020266B7C|nr:RING finger protein 148 [Sphaerodactylus townsendi]